MSDQYTDVGRPNGPERIIPPDESEGIESKVYPITAEVEELMNQFIEDEEIDTNLTGRERMRLFGAGCGTSALSKKPTTLAGKTRTSCLPATSTYR